MDKEKLDELWALVKHVGDVDRLDDGAMLALGSVFGQMRAEIMKLQKENTVKDTIDINEYEAVPYTIALDWESEQVWLNDHVTKRKFVLTEKDSWRIARNFELVEKAGKFWG